jgi:UDP-glucose 4-epimerase
MKEQPWVALSISNCQTIFMNKRVIITGAMGFIGSHTAKTFKQAGYHVIGIDVKDTIPPAAAYLDQLFAEDFVYITPDAAVINDVDAIIHCAGTSLVGPSIADPYTYYNNNSAKINTVLDSLHNKGWHGTVVFSSSAATYGIPLDNRQLHETDPQLPISPYGQSKLFAEHIIKDHCRAHGFKGVALRYFNAAGCDPDGTLGHVIDDTHMIPRVLSAYRNQQLFKLYGNDYYTADGTCIRDYLHVSDIAQAHLDAVQLAERSRPGEFSAYNLGTGLGHSNLEIIKACNQAVKGNINFVTESRRIGDPDYLVANSDLFQITAGWRPVNSSIDHIVSTAWAWEQKHGS